MKPSERLRKAKERGASEFLMLFVMDELRAYSGRPYAFYVELLRWMDATPAENEAIHRIINRFLPEAYFHRNSPGFYYWALELLYPRGYQHFNWLHEHEHSESIIHQIEQIARELLEKGQWTKAPEILKPLITPP